MLHNAEKANGKKPRKYIGGDSKVFKDILAGIGKPSILKLIPECQTRTSLSKFKQGEMMYVLNSL
jgi:hypothetical protein